MERGLNIELGAEDLRVQLQQWVNISTQFKGNDSSAPSYTIKRETFMGKSFHEVLENKIFSPITCWCHAPTVSGENFSK